MPLMFIASTSFLTRVMIANALITTRYYFRIILRDKKLVFFSFLHCYHQRKIRWLEFFVGGSSVRMTTKLAFHISEDDSEIESKHYASLNKK